MGCCGGARTSSKSIPQTTTSDPNALPGKDGYDVLEYIGPSYGTQTFWVGMQTYQFGLNRPYGYVDKFDSAELLSMRGKQGQPLFRKVEQPTLSDAPDEEILIEQEQEEVLAEEPLATEAMEEEIAVQDPTELYVNEITKLDLTPGEAEAMLKLELANKNRVTAVDHLREIADGS